MTKNKILIVEDERVIRNFLGAILTAHDYQILHATTGKEAVTMTASHVPDLVLLDLGLPDMDGEIVLQKIREWSDVPIIVVSARQDEAQKVSCLDAGADDYVTKPFGNKELLARIRATLRQRSMVKDNRYMSASSFAVGGLTIDYIKRQVKVDGAAIHLTPIEYKIVVLLSKSAGMVLTHDYIIREIWGPFASDSQLVRVNMANIRRKIEPDPADPRYILTEVGVGYRMIDCQ